MNTPLHRFRWLAVVAISLDSAACGSGAGTPAETPTLPSTYSVGGAVSGLNGGKSLVLRNNGGDDLTVGASGAFTFSTQLADKAAYTVTVLTQPIGQTCSVTNASGTIAAANVTNVNVNCAPIASCDSITESNLLPHVHSIVGFSQQSKAHGDILWGRIAGEPAAAATADYVAQQFNALALTDLQGHTPAVVQPIHTTVGRWWLTKLSLALQGDAHAFTTMSTFFESKATSGAGLSAEIVDVGDGSTLPPTLAGKIALVQGNPGWSVASGGVNPTVVTNLIARNAAGMILWMNKPAAPGNLTYGYEVPATSATKIVWQMLGMDEGLYLKNYIAAHPSGTAVATMVVEGHNINDWNTENVIGMLPGNGALDEYVLVMAHTDSVFDGANDNASGLANMLALAKHYSAVPQAQRTRHIIFAATGSHHYGPGIGSSALARWLPNQIPNFFAKTALVLNAEHLGTKNPAPGGGEFIYTMGLTDATGPVLRTILADSITKATQDQGLVSAGGNLSTTIKGDGNSFYFASGKQAVVASIMELFYWYHTDHDTEANLDSAKLQRASHAMCGVVDGLVREDP